MTSESHSSTYITAPPRTQPWSRTVCGAWMQLALPSPCWNLATRCLTHDLPVLCHFPVLWVFVVVVLFFFKKWSVWLGGSRLYSQHWGGRDRWLSRLAWSQGQPGLYNETLPQQRSEPGTLKSSFFYLFFTNFLDTLNMPWFYSVLNFKV